tara:strand:- start:1279 stop:1536 length:258 start_codon:yes stop_codon:yes gene_type:complete
MNLSVPLRFIYRPSDVKIAQVQDDFYGNVGTYKVIDLKLMRLVDNKNRVLSLQQPKSGSLSNLRIGSSTRKIGGSNPPLGTNKQI